MTGWRSREARREALGNVGDPRSRSALVVAAALALGLGTSLLLGSEWRSLHRDLSELADAGRGVVVVEGADAGIPARIDVASCRALGGLPDIERAGGFRIAESRGYLQLGPFVPVVEVDPSLLASLRTAPAVIGVELGAFAAPIELRDVRGATLEAIGGERQPSRLAGLNTSVAVALPATTERVDHCAVVLDPFADAPRTIPRLVAALEADTDLIASPVASGGYDVVAAYLARPTRFAPIVVGLLGAAFGLLATRTRGSELAAYRLSGTSRADLVRIVLLEQVLCAGVLVAAGCAGLLAQVVAATPPAPDDPVWLVIAGCVWLVAVGPGVFLASRASPADLARDR